MDGLQHLRRRVLDQLAFCREPLHPAEKEKVLVYRLRREELGVRLAVYRTYRRALVRS